MNQLTITRDDLDEVRRLQIERQWTWPVAFGANARGDIWPYVILGFTEEGLREQVRRVSKVIDAVADAYLKVRPNGGHFSIDDTGALHTPPGERETRFLTFGFWNRK